MTNYPQSVEEKLDFITEAVMSLELEYPLFENCIRETFGQVLFDQWLSGNDDEPAFTEESFHDLLKLAVARSMVQNLESEGLIEIIEADDVDMVFVTEKGRELASTDLPNILLN